MPLFGSMFVTTALAIRPLSVSYLLAVSYIVERSFQVLYRGSASMGEAAVENI